MPELVEQDAEKQRDDQADGDERAQQASRIPEREVAEEDQEQKEAPVDLHVYSEGTSYLEGTTHHPEFTPRATRRCVPKRPARIEGWKNAPKATDWSRQRKTLTPS